MVYIDLIFFKIYNLCNQLAKCQFFYDLTTSRDTPFACVFLSIRKLTSRGVHGIYMIRPNLLISNRIRGATLALDINLETTIHLLVSLLLKLVIAKNSSKARKMTMLNDITSLNTPTRLWFSINEQP
ncbi:hypothetical protein QVD17_09251 [Tagetes erecta]|uniref:Uncharacterized protein n=1 Tax=Tagetes erecta TaxID=13708 RepID=A0AAD8L6Z4_TARER|nr:hypothetical protein QVD17_09251 [Tagetes erecta]